MIPRTYEKTRMHTADAVAMPYNSPVFAGCSPSVVSALIPKPSAPSPATPVVNQSATP
jgi:hypothetical protein